jgi:regulator of sigma E protease
MLGDADASSRADTEALKAMTKEELSQTLHAKSVWNRMLVSFSGPLANFLFAFVVMVFLFSLKGVPTFPAAISDVVKDSYGEQIGLQANDTIIEFNGHAIESMSDLLKEIKAFDEKTLTLKVKREGSSEPVALGMAKEEGFNKPFRLGIQLSGTPTFVKHDILTAIKASFTTIYDICAITIQAIGQMFQGGKGAGELGGILSIGDMAGKSAQMGITAYTWFLVLLSINLGFINLLPLPMLDGGRLLFEMIEVVIRRPVSLKIQEYAYLFGFIVVVGVMLYATWNDLMRYKIVDYVRNLFS